MLIFFFQEPLLFKTKNLLKSNSPCRELKMAKRYMNARFTGPQAKKAKPQVRPSRMVIPTMLLTSWIVVRC